MITPIRTMKINDICQRKDDLLMSADDIEEIAKNVRTKAIDDFVATLVPRLTDAIYQKDVESMTNLINGVAEELKAGGIDE